MKFLYVPLVCVFTTYYSFAQLAKTQHPFADKSWLSINAGVGFPLGDFGDNAPSNPESGFAKIGYMGKVDFGVKIYRSLGLCLSAVGGVNKADESALTRMLPTYTGVNKDVNTSGWKYIGGLGGIYMTTAIGRGAIMFKGQMGYVSVNSTAIEWTLSNGKDYETIKQSSGKCGAIMVDVGISTVIPISEVAFLNLGIDYMSTSPEFKDISVSRTSSFYAPAYQSFNYDMDMKWIAAKVGVLWQL